MKILKRIFASLVIGQLSAVVMAGVGMLLFSVINPEHSYTARGYGWIAGSIIGFLLGMFGIATISSANCTVTERITEKEDLRSKFPLPTKPSMKSVFSDLLGGLVVGCIIWAVMAFYFAVLFFFAGSSPFSRNGWYPIFDFETHFFSTGDLAMLKWVFLPLPVIAAGAMISIMILVYVMPYIVRINLGSNKTNNELERTS